MAKQGGFSGVIAPVLTPFGEDGNPDAGRFVDHAHWLMQEGCTGLAPFGTTSEANSLGLDERMELLEELVDDGIDAATLMPGTGTCSLADTIMLTRHAMDLSCGGVLMLPPFYYKGPSEEGLFRFFAEAIEGVGDDKLKVYLYHIPPVAQVGFSLPLIGRLIKAFPDNVVGLKDSSGDWSNTAAILEAYPNFEVFPGSEIFLLDGLRKGGAGCISATCNVSASAIRNVYDNWKTADADKPAGRHHGAAQGDPGLSDDPCPQGADRALQAGCRLGQGARAVHGAARCGSREGHPHAGRRARLQAQVRQGRVGRTAAVIPASDSDCGNPDARAASVLDSRSALRLAGLTVIASRQRNVPEQIHEGCRLSEVAAGHRCQVAGRCRAAEAGAGRAATCLLRCRPCR